MRPTRLFSFTLLLFLLTCLSPSMIANAVDDDAGEPEEYDVKARVVRISLLSGEVTLKRDDRTEAERARLNYPLVEGDLISTSADARMEIQIDARNFMRLGSNTVLKIVTLRDEGIALSVLEGTVSLRLAKFDPGKESFEIDAPKTTLAAEKPGLYRIDVSKEGHVKLTARSGGRARIYSQSSGFALRDGRTAELITDGADAGEWEVLTATSQDLLDDWIDERERFLVQQFRYNADYYDSNLWGGEDLDAYGTWANTKEYGWIWRPHQNTLAAYDNWAPYRYGQWAWRPPYGWTWVGYEPWGWAPYHYGRWVYYNNYWAWTPRSQYYQKHSWWRPALVAFVVNISFGDQVCWYPLSYHHRDPRSRNYRRRDGHDRDDRRRENWRGVTVVDRRDFGRDHPRTRVADERWRRRIVENEPVGDVPIRPRNERRPVAGDRPGTVAREDRPRTAGEPQRRTGAAYRNPGVPLDGELRRRTWSDRPNRSWAPTATGGAGGVETRPPGTARSSRPVRSVDPTSDGGRDAEPTTEPVTQSAPQNEERPAAPARAFPRNNVPRTEPAQPGATERRRHERPVAPRPENTAPAVGPVRPEPRERPAAPDENGERAPRRSRDEDSPRPEPVERRSDPPPRSEPPPRHEEPPRSDPPARSEPAPRNDPPPRSDPPPRNDPPARSEPAPRNDPPPRSDPPSNKAEPARGDVDKPEPSHKNREPR